MIEEDARRAVARHRSEIWPWVLLDKHRAGLQLLLHTGVWNVLCHISTRAEEEVMWENVILTINAISRQTALLTWATSLGLTSAVTCCNIYREYHAPVVFTSTYIHRFCSSHQSSCLSYIWKVTRPILVLYGWHFLLNLVLFCLTCNKIMHNILPLPLCGLYSIRAQNGYGQHRPCKIVILTLVAPRGVRPISFTRNTCRTRANGLQWNLWNWVSTTIS